MKYSKAFFVLLLVFVMTSSFTLRRSAEIKKKIMADKKSSEISYTMVHPLHEWTGTSKEVNCVMLFNSETNKVESVAVSVLLSTFDSNNSNRDSHALEVLEAIKYPTVKLISSNIQQIGNELTIHGNLTFHNVTRPVTFVAKRVDEKKDVLVDGNFIVNINDYQIETPSLMGVKTKEEITLNFKVLFPIL